MGDNSHTQPSPLERGFDESERVRQHDESAITLEVAGVVRQLAGLPPLMEAMCITENGQEFFLRPGGVTQVGEDGLPIYFFHITSEA